jgi:lipid-binding SYLF domain-containing protein
MIGHKARDPSNKDPSMTPWTRRSFLMAAGASAAGCTSTNTGMTSSTGASINARVAEAQAQLFQQVPGTVQLAQRAQGILIIPGIIEVGIFASGAYGEGALLIGPATVDYYSLSAVSLGFTFGAAEYNQALFFMSSQALQDFRTADGWELGVGAAVVFVEDGAAAGVTTTRINRPIYEVVWGQRGLIAGASFGGAKYNRIIR